MKSQVIIIAILIMVKVIGVASRANADYFCNYKDKDYGFGYNSHGFNEHGQKSILKIAQVSQCNKKMNAFYKSKGIY
mgnify:CR=1 FL=1|jgi:hypothetical protein